MLDHEGSRHNQGNGEERHPAHELQWFGSYRFVSTLPTAMAKPAATTSAVGKIFTEALDSAAVSATPANAKAMPMMTRFDGCSPRNGQARRTVKGVESWWALADTLAGVLNDPVPHIVTPVACSGGLMIQVAGKRCACLSGAGPNGHAQGHERPVDAGTGSSGQGCFYRSPVCVPGSLTSMASSTA